jgi:hypothetical protein
MMLRHENGHDAERANPAQYGEIPAPLPSVANLASTPPSASTRLAFDRR